MSSGISDSKLKNILSEVHLEACLRMDEYQYKQLSGKLWLVYQIKGSIPYNEVGIYWRWGNKDLPPMKYRYPPRAYLSQVLSLMPVKIGWVSEFRNYYSSEQHGYGFICTFTEG